MEQRRLAGSWKAGVLLNWNILDWGKAYQQVQQTGYRIKQVELALQSGKERIKAAILDARRKISESRESFALAQEAVSSAKRALEIAELNFKEGVMADVDLLEKRKNLTNAQNQLYGARVGKELSVVEFNHAIGK
jgi:multidrug efflux system outer membrane protein